jgi:hypothetical protein
VRTPATPGQSWDIHADRGAAVTQRLNARMGSTQLTMRSREEIAGYFDGLDLVDPGLVSVPHWRPVIEPAGLLNAYAGMGRNPWSTNRVLAGSTLPVQSRRLSSPVSKMFYLPMEGPPAPRRARADVAHIPHRQVGKPLTTWIITDKNAGQHVRRGPRDTAGRRPRVRSSHRFPARPGAASMSRRPPGRSCC